MTQESPSEPMLQAAMDWLLRLEAAPADASARAELELWLAADPAHARAWAQARRAWRVIGEVPPEHAARWSRREAVTTAARRSRRDLARRIAGGAAALALAACLAVVLLPGIGLSLHADLHTATAELRRQTLADGTVVHLAPQSAIALRYTGERRGMALLAGEAFFEVASDPSRPFTVEADGVSVTVLGTAFDVRLEAAVVTVGVRSGAVAVRGRALLDARLGPGDRITVRRDSGAAERDRIAPDEVAAWRDGYLFLNGATIADAVEQVRRYQPGWIVVADGQLAAQRVTGLYDLRDPARALRALVEPVGGRVRQVSPYLHVLTAP